MATLNYESANRKLPPGLVDDDSDLRDAKHNGFVFLLPYLEESAIHDRYNFDESWKSANNQAVAANARLEVLLCPSNESSVANTGRIPGEPTDYAFCKGEVAYLCDKPSESGMYDVNSHTRIRSVIDGMSKTMALGEAVSDATWKAAPP